MDEKISKLQLVTNEAEEQMKICKAAFDESEKQLTEAKEKYRSLPKDKQETLKINDTELPELLETNIRAKNVYETAQTRYATNKRYLEVMKHKQTK